MPVAHVAPELVLVVGAALTLVAAMALPHRRQWVGAPLAVATAAAVIWLTASMASTEPQRLTFFGTWALDGAAIWAKHIILVSTIIAVAASPEWLRRDPRHGEYYTLLLLSALGAVVLASAADSMLLVMGVLLSSAPGYALAAYHRRSPLSVEAGMKYFLVGALTNILLTLGVVLLFGLAATTLYADTAGTLAASDGARGLLTLAVAFVAVGLAFKLGAVPAHAWMPDVAQGAPAPAAAFLTVVPKIGGLVALARFLSLLPEDQAAWRPAAAVLAAATMTLGNLAALWQDDVRRLLGWSAVSQSGYGLMALVALDRSPLALPALLYFLLAYALANLAAFAVVAELRGRTRLEDYAGLARRRPLLAAVLVVAFLSLVGIPPLAGFAAKLTLFGATIAAGYGWLAFAAVVNTVVSLFYYLRVLGPVYFAPQPEPVPLLGRWAGLAAVGAGLGAIAVGLVAEPLIHAFTNARLLP
ncbi:MAG: NADH-quinone oxidoreductase subunit N [Actinomycetota bacterium]|nr:NADH-quinone oxidoreductase subunit N [Actinomycetota bacterium]